MAFALSGTPEEMTDGHVSRAIALSFELFRGGFAPEARSLCEPSKRDRREAGSYFGIRLRGSGMRLELVNPGL